MSPATCLCAACGETQPRPAASATAPLCGACDDPLWLDGRYLLLDVLGHGGNATTYRAERVADGHRVAIKELLLRKVDAFKTLDLFEREAATLRTLAHPGIPAYVDKLTAGSGKQQGFYLVQELVVGQSLQAELDERRYTEADVAAILTEVADILTYLHGLRPPVIHRDLKPSNIMRRAADERLVLIDFGAVREALGDPNGGGSTVAGTFGYMAPEQFAGQASPATDLYGLGATAVALLTRRSPQELLDSTHELRWEAAVSATPGLRALLRALLTRDPDQRVADAARVRDAFAALARGEAPRDFGPPAAPSTDPSAALAQAGFDQATLLQLMKGEVPVAEFVKQLQPATGLASNPRHPPPRLFREPPPAPRSGGWRRARKVDAMAGFNLLFGALFGGIGGFIGVVFVLVSLFSDAPALMGFIGGGVGLIFGGIGGGIFYKGVERVRALTAVWRDGRVAHGDVDDVKLDTTVRANGRSPWQINFHFTVRGVAYTGVASTWNPLVRLAHRGQKIAVLYSPADPSQNLAYLPDG